MLSQLDDSMITNIVFWLRQELKESLCVSVRPYVWHKVLIRSLNLHLSRSDQSAGSEQSVSTQRAFRASISESKQQEPLNTESCYFLRGLFFGGLLKPHTHHKNYERHIIIIKWTILGEPPVGSRSYWETYFRSSKQKLLDL